MSGKSFDPIIWWFLRKFWEAYDKISYADLCELVSQLLGQETPSPAYVAKKAKSEKWIKNKRAYCRNSDRNLQKTQRELFEELKKEYEKYQADNVIGEMDQYGKLIVFSDVSNPHISAINDIAYKNRTTAGGIQEHRRRAGRIGQLTEETMEWLYESKEAAFRIDLTSEEQEIAHRKYRMVADIVSHVDSLSNTALKLMKMDIALFGITPDDTKEAVTSTRMSKLNDDTVFDQARLGLSEQYKAMTERTQYINSGTFEAEVEEEMKRRIALEEMEIEQNQDLDDLDEVEEIND